MLVYYLQMLDTPEEKVKFEQIYLKYQGLMYQVADGILHNRQDAEDAVHNAFLRIIKKISRFQNTPAKDLAPQVAVIARNEAISLQRKQKAEGRSPAGGLGRPCRAVGVHQRLPCAGGQLCPASPDLPGRHGDETAVRVLRWRDRRQAGPE